ncbi:nucleotide exchange factor GrpE [Actinomarinicola tropica]|uniref:Protein GrpE n=1 Tax=Actinomarinicola tropica TaxID=2789776 RepID=A0A5Q2RLQ8_9ACTN|nr:nucleotide exchange factor GrpE [Actinomarinicola tropica]QGG96773.1 nucleotide exchange factor GrpE [Actinomarinicola tropica]
MTEPLPGPDQEPTVPPAEGADGAPAPAPGGAPTPAADRPDVDAMAPDDLESLATDTLDRLDAVTAERDDYLDRLRHLQADFENFKKRSTRDHHAAAERATGRLAESLLPVLDACDAALLHGADGVEPVFAALLGVLEKEGLERIDPLDRAFDPEYHEAVMHEHGEGDAEGPVVVDVLRPGYAWKGKVIRAAMVKVRG